MDSRVVALADILRLNTKLFRNCLDGLTDEQGGTRPSATTNSAAFIAAHVADARFYLLKAIGEERIAWTEVSHAIRDRLEVLTAADLDASFGSRFPGQHTVLGVLTFLVQHDSYHVGQLALLRKYAGLPAMRYS
jgi:uncharacterized damage-inducible protein DinB